MNNNTEKNIIKSSRKGFTLVELLVVVAILGILGTIGLQGVTKHIENTLIMWYNSSRKETVRAIL